MCPGAQAAQRLLDESPGYGRRLLPGVAADESNREEHAKAYWDWDWARTTKQICNINTGVVLRKAEWRAFFRHLTNNSADKIRSGERKPGTPDRRRLRG